MVPDSPSRAPGSGGDQLGRRAARGSAWVVLGYGATQVIRFGSSIVLTRLLAPRAFGLMLLLNVFLQGLQMFSDLGIGTSVIQNRRSDAAFLDTAWTIQILRGLVLWLVTLLVAWPYSAVYGEPQLLWMLPVAGLTAAIDGFSSMSIHTANRTLRMGRLQIFDLVVQVSTTLVMIVGAWLTRSVWALLVGMLAGNVVRAVLSHLFFPGLRAHLQWEKSAAASILHFGKWVSASSVVTFLAQQGDRLLFGKMIPLARLGVYNVASTLCEAPSSLISTISFRVFFPLFSEMRRSSPDVDSAYRRASSSLALLGGAGALMLLVAGPLLVSVLYDNRYAEAGAIVQLLAVGIWANSLVHFTAAAVLAGGHIKWLAGANVARLVWVITTVPLAFRVWGFEAAVLLVALSDLPRYVVLGFACRRDGLHVFASDARRTAAFGVAAAAGLLVRQATGSVGVVPVTIASLASLAVWVGLNLEAARWYLAKARTLLASRLA